jgi:hypothetical protein
MSKVLRQACWAIGSLNVSLSILNSGYVSHAKGFADSELKAMAMAS